MKLFDEPFDLDDVDKALCEDYAQFSQLAFCVLGRPPAWHAALDQVARLIDAYEAAGRDDRPAWKLVTLLMERARTFDDTSNYLDALVDRLSVLPGTAVFKAIKFAHVHKTDPQAYRRAEYRAWVDQYHAQMDALGKAAATP